MRRELQTDRAGTVPPKLALFGRFGSGNFGNDGSLEAMLNFLRVARPDAVLTCICTDPGKVETACGIPSIAIGGEPRSKGALRFLDTFPLTRKLLRALRALRNAREFDALIVPGTGILDDFGDRFWGMPASLFGWCLAARLSGTKVAFVSVGAGPINHSVSRWLMKSAARLAQYRSYRDAISKDYMQGIGLNTKGDPVFPDIAFKLPAPKHLALPPRGSQTLTVGVGVMAYYGWRADVEQGALIYSNYLAQLARFVLWLVDAGHHVRILKGENNDQRAVDDLLRNLETKRPAYPRGSVTAQPSASLHDLMLQMAETHVVVATRFHNIVCALKLNRPTISIGYADKNDVLMADMGLGDFCQHIEHLDADLLTRQFTRLVAGFSHYEKVIAEMNSVYGIRLIAQEQQLIARIL